MKILAIEHELPNTESQKFQQYARAEAAQIWNLYQQGFIREMYFRADKSEAVLVLECESLTAAQQVLSSLPLVAHDLITFEFIPLKAYPGFERLFAPLA
jgi:muconolactone delta-isomerase